ncbi:MAG: hypothetical protein Q9167_006272 [Letrouitia subvulpina]
MSCPRLLFNILAVFIIFQLVAAIPAPSSLSFLNARAPAAQKHWHGWDKIDKMFVLSRIYTYNHAAHGAEVDRTAVSDEKGGNDMVSQISTVFTPYYTSKGVQNRRGDWSPESTLFISFFGINDILNSYEDQNSETMDHIFRSYSNNLESLYDLGARNFLLLNVPPLDIAPRFRQDADKAALIARSIADYNSRLSGLAGPLQNAHPDVSVFYYDVNGAFHRIQANPASTMAAIGHPPLTILGRYCQAYQDESSRANRELRVWDESKSFQQSCMVPVDQYFWLDGLHPTWPVHKVMAKEIAQYLSFPTVFGLSGA